MRQRLLDLIHAGIDAHPGSKKTCEQLQHRAYWPTWRSDTELFCKTCELCNRFHRGKVPKHGPLQDMRVGMPLERLHVDLTGPHPPTNGFQYICTVLDAFTKFVTAWPIRDKRATTVARGIVEHAFMPDGVCSYLLTDNGSEFENEFLREICKILGVAKQHTTPYNPACNGAVERWHRSLNATLAKTIQDRQRDWL